MLCKTCQAPETLPAFGERPDILKNIPNVIDELMPLLALHATANAGCIRCTIIQEAVNKLQNIEGNFYHVEHPEYYVIGIAPMPGPGAKAARTGAIGLTVWATRKEGWEHYGYLAWSRNDHMWEFDVKFELYAECEATSARYQIPLLNSVPSNPRPEDYARQAKYWLNHCLTNHADCCSNASKELPTRVIDVGDAVNHPKLVKTRSEERDVYCALSYCWGQSRAFTTTLATFEDRRKGFSVEELPETIRDAVILARGLNIRYIWVDSLCIIQDSATDWVYEASRMCAVYTNAAITFAAIDSPASETGLLVAGPGRHCISLEKDWGPIYARVHSHSGLDDPRALQRDGLAAGVLHTRGWCLQEIALSTRILWMKSNEMNWSCIRSSACECDPQPTDTLHRSGLVALEFVLQGVRYHEFTRSHPSQWLNLWNGLVLNYTGRRLTHISDRLPAIAGLATLVHRHMQVRYLFGLWETQGFLEQLLWSSLTHADESEWSQYTSDSRLRLKADLAPSWSWPSSSAHLSIPYEDFSDPGDAPDTSSSTYLGGPRTRVWSLRSIVISLSTSNLFGTGTGTITLHSLLVPVKTHTQFSKGEVVRSLVYSRTDHITSAEDVPLVLLRRFDQMQIWEIEDEDRSYTFDIWRKDSRIDYEDKHEWYEGRKLYFIFANVSYNQRGAKRIFNGLLLERLGDNELAENSYRRLGYGEGVFLKLNEAQPNIRRAPDYDPIQDSEVNFTRASWEYWKDLGEWSTIRIV
ncbi:heterokaryon incompatibility protein-domain-containing protein [Pyrenochaeta sp. MPI-SDFR-AT-0127]|nr:heterokaryon incompatibility protein-domain-containing protein [Pyrenochaeta sp. MPI-SDFR-AT-0127]